MELIDALTWLRKKECAGNMGQKNRSYASSVAWKDVHINHREEECAGDTEQKNC